MLTLTMLTAPITFYYRSWHNYYMIWGYNCNVLVQYNSICQVKNMYYYVTKPADNGIEKKIDEVKNNLQFILFIGQAIVYRDRSDCATMYSKKKHSIFISYQGQVSLEYTLKMLISARVFFV